MRSSSQSRTSWVTHEQSAVADPNVLEGAEFDLVVSNFGLSDIDDLGRGVSDKPAS